MAGKSPRLGPKQYRDNGDRCFAIAVTCTTTLAGEDHELRLIANCCDGRNDMSVPILHSRSCRENMVPTRKPPPGPMDHELAVIAVTLLTIQREARGRSLHLTAARYSARPREGKEPAWGVRSCPNALARGSQEARVNSYPPGRLRIGGLLSSGDFAASLSRMGL